MVQLQAPNPVSHIYQSDFIASVFLAGGTSNCPDWQTPLIEKLRDYNLLVFNPRRDNFDTSDLSMTEKQIEWEFEMLQRADLVSFWFPSETLCPITLFELGIQIGSNRRVVVGCHPDYARKYDVIKQLELARNYVQVVFSLEELAEHIVQSLITYSHPIDKDLLRAFCLEEELNDLP